MSLKGLKVIFMGTPEFSVASLQALIDKDCEISAVITQPDRPKGRGRKLVYSPIKELTLKEGLTLFQPQKVRDEQFINQVKEMAPHFIAVVAFGQILPLKLLEIPQLGCINVHGSLLPTYRGAAPVNWAVVNGEKLSGVTTMLMDEGMDTGDMLLKKEVKINNGETSENLYNSLSTIGAELLVETLEGLAKGEIKAIKQDDEEATYAPILKKSDGLIDWSKEAGHIENLVRGMLPWPTGQTTLKGKTLKIFKAEKGIENGSPGTILHVTKDAIHVATGKGSLAINELQLEGKRKMTTDVFLRGFAVEVGEKLGQ